MSSHPATLSALLANHDEAPRPARTTPVRPPFTHPTPAPTILRRDVYEQGRRMAAESRQIERDYSDDGARNAYHYPDGQPVTSSPRCA